MKTARDVKRSQPAHAPQVPGVVLAGYTNAGKSSLLNRLTDAGVLVENALFATLDPTVRRARDRRRPGVHARRHGRLRPAPADPAGRGVPLDAGGGRRRRPDPARRRRRRRRPGGADPRGARGARPTSTRCDVPEQLVFNKVDAADAETLLRLRHLAPGRGVRLGAHRRGPRRAARPRSRTGCRARPSRSTVLVPVHPRRPGRPDARRRRGARHRAHRRTARGCGARVGAELAAALAQFARRLSPGLTGRWAYGWLARISRSAEVRRSPPSWSCSRPGHLRRAGDRRSLVLFFG